MIERHHVGEDAVPVLECDEMGTSGWWQNFHESQKLSFNDRKPGCWQFICMR
jgi:hypothetical protein